MLSPRSRGKGSRRRPGRDGGRRKWKVAEWRKQATHAVGAISELVGELTMVEYHCPFRRTAGECIYWFDQEAARIGLWYYAELPNYYWFPVFKLYVPVDRAEAVRGIIARLPRR
jgi:hypothetical protein